MTNIEKLARLIVRTGNADKIMTVFALGIAVCNPEPEGKEGGAAQ